uniref:Uncharacterized protein n=1 Tax=Setaria digitata TaxID=48799 RepID=A0A915PY84_9BILA
MPRGGTLCQVQNLSAHASRKVEELKTSKTTATNIKDDKKEVELKIRNRDVKKNSANVEEKLNETKVPKLEIAHESPKTAEALVQTDVVISIKSPKLTAEDLRSPEVSANYWRRLAERLYAENERELKINFELSVRIAKLNEEIAEKEEDYSALKHYVCAEKNAAGNYGKSKLNEVEEAKSEVEVHSDENVLKNDTILL